MFRQVRLPLWVLSIALLGVSCVRFVGPEDIRYVLSDQAGVQLEQETGFTFTRSAIWLARNFVEEEDFTLEGVRRVEIGVYEVQDYRPGQDSPAPLDLTNLEGWEPLVRVHEPGEDVMVLFKEKDEVIRALLIVVAEPDEWVLVRIRGKLNQVMEQAMEAAFDDVDRPDLYAKTRRERGLDPPIEARGQIEEAEDSAALFSHP